MTQITYGNTTFEVFHDLLEVTSPVVKDLAWKYRDPAGHRFGWNENERVNGVKWIVDYPGDDEYPEEGHHECRRCGAVVEPGWKPNAICQHVEGLSSCLINGKEVTREEFTKALDDARINCEG